MSAHTPGPWNVGSTEERRYASGVFPETRVQVGEGCDRGNTLAIVYLGGPGATSKRSEDIEANARLIAAAPELADALEGWNKAEQARTYIPERERPAWDALMAATRAALRKAGRLP